MSNAIRKVINFFYRQYLSHKPIVQLDALSSAKVVAWCSDYTHLREQLPVLQKIAQTHPVGFITNKKDIYTYITTHTSIPAGILKFSKTETPKLINVFKSALSAVRYILIGNDLRKDDRSIMITAQQLNIAHGVITHGLNYLNQSLYESVSQTLFVWAKEEKNRMVGQGIKPERIIVSGSPYFESLRSTTALHTDFNKWKARFTKRYNSANKQAILVAVSGPGNMYTMTDHHQSIISLEHAAEQLDSTHCFWVKLHRKDKPEYYNEAVHLIVVANEHILPHISSLVPLIELASIVISGASTAVIEAMILQKPVIIFDHHPFSKQLPFVNEQAVAASDDVHAVMEQIKLLQQSDYLHDYLDRQNRFLRTHLFEQTQISAVEIIFNHIHQQIKNSA
jgi:hypothetical protein